MDRKIIWSVSEYCEPAGIIAPPNPVYMTINHWSIKFLGNSSRTCKDKCGLIEKFYCVIRPLIRWSLISHKYTEMRLVPMLHNLPQGLFHWHHQSPEPGSDLIENTIKLFIRQGLVNNQHGLLSHNSKAIDSPFPIAVMRCQYHHRTPLSQKINDYFRIYKIHSLQHLITGDGSHFESLHHQIR